MLYLVNLIVVNLHYLYNLSMITKKEAIQFAGSVTELAKILGISKAAISQWGEIPPQARVWQMQSLHPEWFLFR